MAAEQAAGRRKSRANQQRRSLASSGRPAKCLETMVFEQLETPQEVQLFEQFEELSKLYAIDPPYLSRTQVELMFDVYDGQKLQATGYLDEELAPEMDAEAAAYADIERAAQVKQSFERRAPAAEPQTAGARRRKRTGGTFSWCKLLSGGRGRGGLKLRCCVRRSETNQEFCRLSASLASGLANESATPRTSSETICAALLPGHDDDPDEVELKGEAVGLVGALLSRVRRDSRLGADRLESVSLEQQQPQLQLDATLEASSISVCLFDKRGRKLRLKDEAENGRRWWRFEARMRELSTRLRGAGALTPLMEQKLERFVARKMQPGGLAGFGPAPSEQRMSKEQLEQLVDLKKVSLNHLIDAQLVLRNKLTSEQEQQQQFNRAHEYEALLRNNFNLLKIWQNLEETKRLVCFVCEPIKATLADLFWFSRQPSELAGVCFDRYLLASPLVSLDAVQVKRGLIQILEALHYLHAICKLVHRNLNPRNVLIASADNWKLSGLEFALRFESATISESASMMAHEGGSLLRYSSGVGAQLRRQRTLHQTRCDEFVKTPRNGLFQPDVNYLAPEIWSKAKCSHKSDLFSYGLLLAQTYDLCRHRSPISCRSQFQNYESELKKLNARKRKIARQVPFEMRSVLLAMLDSEPNTRPSANYALQLFRRPIELCSSNEDSLRHLRRSLGYLDAGRWLNSNNTNLTNPSGAGGGAPLNRKRANFFKKVTSATNNQWPGRRQAKNLHLLNLLLRGLDSAASSAPGSGQPLPDGNVNEFCQRQVQPHHNQQQPPLFAQLRHQFEHTFESLRQVYQLTMATCDSFICLDSRFLMLLVALHRRLLDQVYHMRAELPPLSRLTAANAPASRPTANHRALAELEDKLQCLVSQQSLAKLAPVLTDPLLKLDEFLLVYELINDLLAFVGQKCRQGFIQRGRQLLNELTPVTGCPSLSSSDEEDSGQVDEACYTTNAFGGSAIVIGGNRQALSGSRGTLNNISNNNSIHSRMSGRFSDFDDTSIRPLRGRSHQTTKISITAPSPRGSIREVNTAADSRSAPRRQTRDDEQLSQMAGEMSLNNFVASSSYNQCDDLDAVDDESDISCSNARAEEAPDAEGDKSRSQLIDELLKTINDDSFSDLVEFNNKFAAQASASSQQLTAAQLANANRPKSAMDSTSRSRPSSSGANNFTSTRQQPQPTGRPSSLALGAGRQQAAPSTSTFDNVIRRMSTNLVQNFNKIGVGANLLEQQAGDSPCLRREKSSMQNNSLYVDNQVPARRHSDNTINVPRIQVALSSPQTPKPANLNQRAGGSASKLANKWKLTAKSNQTNKLSPNLSGALGYMRRHSSGNTTGSNEQSQSNGQTSTLLLNASPFKTKSSSNLGLDFLTNRSMKRRYSAASMLGHQTQRKAEDLIDAGIKGVQNMFG